MTENKDYDGLFALTKCFSDLFLFIFRIRAYVKYRPIPLCTIRYLTFPSYNSLPIIWTYCLGQELYTEEQLSRSQSFQWDKVEQQQRSGSNMVYIPRIFQSRSRSRLPVIQIPPVQSAFVSRLHLICQLWFKWFAISHTNYSHPMWVPCYFSLSVSLISIRRLLVSWCRCPEAESSPKSLPRTSISGQILSLGDLFKNKFAPETRPIF